jgi:hypothetical protein
MYSDVALRVADPRLGIQVLPLYTKEVIAPSRGNVFLPIHDL